MSEAADLIILTEKKRYRGGQRRQEIQKWVNCLTCMNELWRLGTFQVFGQEEISKKEKLSCVRLLWWSSNCDLLTPCQLFHYILWDTLWTQCSLWTIFACVVIRGLVLFDQSCRFKLQGLPLCPRCLRTKHPYTVPTNRGNHWQVLQTQV